MRLRQRDTPDTLCYVAGPVKLYSEDVAARLGITRAAFATMRNPRRARPKLKPPAPDGVDIEDGHARPYWWEPTIDAYERLRPGRGARTDLAPDSPGSRSGESGE